MFWWFVWQAIKINFTDLITPLMVHLLFKHDIVIPIPEIFNYEKDFLPIQEWLENNVGKRYFSWWLYGQGRHAHFCFKNNETAIAFKLVWGVN